MNYYEMVQQQQSTNSKLDNIYSRLGGISGDQSELLTEVRQLRSEVNLKLDTINNTLTGGITLISVLLVVSCAIKVIFR